MRKMIYIGKALFEEMLNLLKRNAAVNRVCKKVNVYRFSVTQLKAQCCSSDQSETGAFV